MTVFNAIYRRLVAVSGITALVGTSPARIWESEAKNGTLPAIVIEVDIEIDTALQKRPADHYTVTVSVIAANPQDRETIASLIRDTIARQAWIDEDIQIVSVSSPMEAGSADAESGSGTGSNDEAMYFQSIATYEVIAGDYPFAATAIVQVAGDGMGNVEVTFNGPMAAASVDPTQMAIDIDMGNAGTAVQISANVVGFTCGSSFEGAVWEASAFFATGIPDSSGTVVAL